MENVSILQKNYMYELLGCCALSFCVMIYFWGIKKNHGIAWLWYENNIKLFENQFLVIGVPETSDIIHKMEQETNNEWKFFATGRKNCNYCYVHLETKKRHDLFAMTLLHLYWPQQDRVTYTIPLIFDDMSQMPKICFSVLRKRLLSTFKTENKELD